MSQGSTSAPPDKPVPQQMTLYWQQLPSIRILRPPKGKYSARVDERCFTYCSQTVRGRTEQTEPWCRSICLRKIFDHEVRKILGTHARDPSTSNHSNSQTISDDVEFKFPLPPEGQPTPIPDTSRVAGGMDDSDDEHTDFESAWSPSSIGKGKQRQVRYWQDGWYVWLSKNRWAAQEKMDLMMYDLARQAEWQKHKEKMNVDWEAYQRQGQDVHSDTIAEPVPEDRGPVVGPMPTQVEHTPIPPNPANFEWNVVPSPGPPFPDISSQSFLAPVPPSLTVITDPLKRTLLPTKQLLSVTYNSLQNGDQLLLAKRLWEKAKTPDPFILAGSVIRKTWKAWSGGSEDEEGGNTNR